MSLFNRALDSSSEDDEYTTEEVEHFSYIYNEYEITKDPSLFYSLSINPFFEKVKKRTISILVEEAIRAQNQARVDSEE